MEIPQREEQPTYAVRSKPERRVRWSCMLPVSLVNAVKRYSEESGIPQTTIVKRATEKALREIGVL